MLSPSFASAAWHRYWRILLPLLLAPFIAALFEFTTLDQVLIAPFYDAHAHGFPLRGSALLQNLMHFGLKLAVVLVAVAVFGAALLGFLLPQRAHERRRLLWILAAMGLSTALVAMLKTGSAMHCPWDVADYGGYAPFHHLFERPPAGIAPGHCFPGGHASGGFSLMAFYFAWRDRHPRRARMALAAGWAMGMLMGWSQMMRGAHFMSHNIWSGWLVWTAMALQYHFFPPVSPAAVMQPPLPGSREAAAG